MAANITPSTPAPLTLADVRKVAALSRLALTEGELAASQARLTAILSYVDRLRSLDLAAVEPLYSPHDMAARLADDIPGPVLPTSALLAIAPATDGPFVAIPKVIAGGAGGAGGGGES